MNTRIASRLPSAALLALGMALAGCTKTDATAVASSDSPKADVPATKQLPPTPKSPPPTTSILPDGEGDPGEDPLPASVDEALRTANHVGAFTVLSGPIEEELAMGPTAEDAHVWPVHLVHRYVVRFEGDLDESWRDVAPSWAPTDAASGGLQSVSAVTEVLVTGGITQYVDDDGNQLVWTEPGEVADHPMLPVAYARPLENPLLAEGVEAALFLHQIADFNGKWFAPTNLFWRVDGAFAIRRDAPPAEPTVLSETETLTFEQLRVRAASAFSTQWTRMLDAWLYVDMSDWVAPPKFAAALPNDKDEVSEGVSD